MDEDDSTVRFCPVPQAMSMSALSVDPLDCMQYGLHEMALFGWRRSAGSEQQQPTNLRYHYHCS